jgi:hypothetical protein
MRTAILAMAAAVLAACACSGKSAPTAEHKDAHGLETPVVTGGLLPILGPQSALNSAASLPPGFEDGSPAAIQSRIRQESCGF